MFRWVWIQKQLLTDFKKRVFILRKKSISPIDFLIMAKLSCQYKMKKK